MTKERAEAFRSTICWLREVDHKSSSYDMDRYASNVIERYIDVPPQDLLPLSVIVCFRKRGITNVPFCQSVLEFRNYTFQTMVPCLEEDASLNWSNFKNELFPSRVDCDPDFKEFSSSVRTSIKDFSGKEKRVDKEIYEIRYSKKTEISESSIDGMSGICD